jgi:DNA sulfur modification protein DndE
MIVKQIKLANQSKDKLSRLKGKTGIQNWNILCRWALCFSLSESTVPNDYELLPDSNVEISWLTFAGEYHEIYDALIRAWCLENNLPTDEEHLAHYFKIHLNRGISYLAGTNFIKSIDDLVNIALKKQVTK